MKPAFNRILRLQPQHLLWIVAIALGLLAAWAARHHLTKRVADIEARAKGDTLRLVVARSDLPAGAWLDADKLAVREVPLAWAQSGAVRPEHFNRVEGQALAHPLKSGEQLLWALLEGERAPTFSARVESGRRAVTVPVDEISSISGLLEPGDQIDMVVTVDQSGQRRAVPVLSHVRVMATGQRADNDSRSGERRLYTTVTLDLAPHEAANLILARESGRLTAMLRHPEDRQPLPGVPARFADWLRGGEPAVTPMAVAAPRPPSGIPIHYGGRSHAPVADALRLPESDPAIRATAPLPVLAAVPSAPGLQAAVR